MKKTLSRIAIATFFVAISIAPTVLVSSKHPATADGMPGKKTPIVADGLPGKKTPIVADGLPGKKTPVVVIADGLPGSKVPPSATLVNV